MIKLSQLNKYFFKNKKNEIHVLNNVNLEIGDKGLVVIRGASGSGKTTLLNVIGGLDSIQTGKIDFFEHHLDKYDAKVWDQIRNEHIGYIFQNYYLLPELSVYENIRFVLKILGITDEDYIESRVNYVLKAVGMYPFRKKKALQLSGGQQQRVAIARALVKNPKVVIADEPTGNLDSKNTIEIMNIIKEIAKEKLVILVTHEQNIASMYGDRIIEFENGQIIKEDTNDQYHDHSVTQDDTIYLKDIKINETLENKTATLNLYLDEEIEKPVDIKVIIKNNTVYLDVKSDYENVRLIDKQSNVKIKDAHYKKKTKEEIQQTSFKTEEIDHQFIEKDKTLILSFKQTFKMALDKLIRTSRKGKLMLLSFFVAGAIIALAIATLSAVAFIKAEAYIRLPKGYVEIQTDHSYDELMTLKENDQAFYINPYGGANIFFLNADNSPGMALSAQVDILDHASAFKLKKGTWATKPEEIMISSSLAEQFIKSGASQDFGIWNEDQLLKETVDFGNRKAKITGIVDTLTPLIFGDPLFLAYVHSSLDIMPFEAFENVLTFGAAPVGEQVVISEAEAKSLLGKNSLANTDFPFNFAAYKISGTHDMDNEAIMLANANHMYIKMVDEMSVIHIYSSNPSKLVDSVDDKFSLDATDIYASAFENRMDEQKTEFIASLTSTMILIGFSLIGFYFVIRSSMIERIYEVSVYRALGVKKKDIFRSFLVEIFVITTISSLMGFIFLTIILARLQRGLFGQLNFFYVNSISTLIGIITVYGLNLLAGVIPIYMLLRKTPAQILSQYDI